MSPDMVARCTLAGYGLVLCGLIVWRALASPAGWRRWMLYVIDTLYSRILFRWRSNGPCPFDFVEGAILIANHRGPVDPVFIWTGVTSRRPLGFLTAAEYCVLPGLRFICDNLESIPTKRSGRDIAATRAALRRLQDGKLLGIFPEGRINMGSGLLPANPGVGWLALKSRAPVYPIFLQNAPLGRSMVRAFFDFRPVRVLYGAPIDLSAYYDRGLSEEVVLEATQALMRGLAELGGIEYVPQESIPEPKYAQAAEGG